MAESTLSITYSTLMADVGFFLGFGRDTTAYTTNQTAFCDDCVQRGYRRFLNPAPTPNAPQGHVWSFLSPLSTLSLTSGTDDYDLPDDFGSPHHDSFVTIDSSSLYRPLDFVGEGVIRQWRVGTSRTGHPTHIAIRPKAAPSGTAAGQRWVALIWPTPDGSYTLQYRYNVLVNELSDSNTYPLGGMLHGETIMQACRAEAERRHDDTQSVEMKSYEERLLASIALDQKSQPTRLGYNADHVSDTAPQQRELTYGLYEGNAYGPNAP